ncbi:hypothetical protein [Leptospira mayottensis]|uniref:hypothetical protein n=1 Tax=Leptospira mayottensis TaxID=1137606 RepID=UPI0002D52C36|nr:hypothetical protein [Leptospira mayottensis]
MSPALPGLPFLDLDLPLLFGVHKRKETETGFSELLESVLVNASLFSADKFGNIRF